MERLENEIHRDGADDREKEKLEDHRRQASLYAYYRQMMELMLEHGLEPEGGNSKAGTIARALTLAVLPTLDGRRKAQLLDFLCDTKLLKEPAAAFHMGRADLRDLLWSKVHISGIQLGGVDLRGANLCSHVSLLDSVLSNAILNCANLTGIQLKGSDLRESDLRCAMLRGANLEGTDLSQTDLRGADLTGAYLYGANLMYADLRATILKEAKLNTELRQDSSKVEAWIQAKLEGAKLEGADLTDADLTGANLQFAKLKGVKNWTISQLKVASYGEFRGTEMPDGVALQAVNDNDEVLKPGPTFAEWTKNYLHKHGGVEADLRDAAVITYSLDSEVCEC